MKTDWKAYWERKRKAEGSEKPNSVYRPHTKWYNYKGVGVYMITIVTYNRKPILGELNNDTSNPRVELSALGKYVEQQWLQIPAVQALHKRRVSLLGHQVMPDHFHGILRVDAELDVSMGEIIRGFKISCTKEWRQKYQTYMSDIELEKKKSHLSHISQKKRQAYYVTHPEMAPLFTDGYDDTICFHEGQINNVINYVRDNPRRAILKRANPQLFVLNQNIEVAGFRCTTLGKQFLIDYPQKAALQCSRSLTQEQIDMQKEQCLADAERGTVWVSACISEGEKQISKALREAGFSIIILLKDGFPKPDSPHYKYFKPQGAYFEACADGRLLLVEPTLHLFDDRTIDASVSQKAGMLPHDTLRYKFLALNVFAQLISNQTLCVSNRS